MTLLNRSTRRRLKNLRQLPCVWEGDRYPLQGNSGAHDVLLGDNPSSGDCILWVDGAAGVVRSMEMVSGDVGQEAVVRGLLRAMEHPNGQMEPARPKRIVVRNRELQFFLRGVLQDLDIEVNYADTLPLIDEIFQGLQSFLAGNQPSVPPEYADTLQEAAIAIWQDAPWEKLDEEKIIEVCLQDQDVEPLYLSFLGMLGVEFGVLMYRSKESLKAFRQKVLTLDETSQELLEEAFLQQDCLFLTFEPLTDPSATVASNGRRSKGKSNGVSLSPTAPPAHAEFGTLHPLEGMRPTLYEEEALVVLASLQALHLFLQEHGHALHLDQFPPISAQYSIAMPPTNTQILEGETIVAQLSTLPDFAEELAAMVDEALADEPEEGIDLPFRVPVINPETVPPGTMSQVGRIPWDVLEALRLSAKVHQTVDAKIPMEADGFPIVLLQTSRPKAMKLIEIIQDTGGLQSLGFIPGEDQWGELSYDLGVLQTQDDVLHIFTEYDGDDAIHQKAKEKWEERCQKSNGYCGLIIAKGVTGAARGNPSLRDMVALFEVRSLTPEAYGFGMLRLVPNMDFHSHT